MQRSKERSKSTKRDVECKSFKNLSVFNSLKDSSLLATKKQQSQKEALDKLKEAAKKNNQCSICVKDTKSSKYIGF